MKKTFALVLATAMILASSIGASAVTVRKRTNTTSPKTTQTNQNGYTLEVDSDKTAAILKDGTLVEDWELKNTKITLLRSKADGIAVQFLLDGGTTKRVTLGSANKLSVEGSLDSLTLASTLLRDAQITVDEDTQIRTMSVACTSEVRIDGSVERLEITNRSGNVTASSTADIASLRTLTRAAFSGSVSGDIRLITSSDSQSWDAQEDTRPNNAPYSGRYYDKTSGRYYYYDNSTNSFYYNDSSGNRHYDANFTPSNYNDGTTYRQYYADGTWADVQGSWGKGSDIGVSSAKVTGSNILEFTCDLEGADVYWNGYYLGRSSKGNNRYNVSAYTGTRNNTLKLSKNGYTGTNISVAGYYYDPNYAGKDGVIGR